MINNTYVKTILILAANPTSTSRLRLDEEVREIDEGLRRAHTREEFKLEQKWAVRQRDFYRAILDCQPQIIHFSAHGAGQDGIVLDDEMGQPTLISADALGSMFKLFATKGVECVLLNACYLEVQAEAISQHVNYVIGMNSTVGDKAAIAFAVAFYDAIAAGEEVEFAYELGCSQIMGFLEQQTPVLRKKQLIIPIAPQTEVIPPNPYQGLSAFEEEDAAFFFGRETFVNGLVQATHQEPLVAVIGPSGSGKSSVVFAGLIPQLRGEGIWLIESFRPSHQPFYQLASALVRQLEPEIGETEKFRSAVGLAADMQQGKVTLQQVVSSIRERNSDKRLLLFVDQFEELYTLCQKEEQERFTDMLLEAIHQKSLTLVFTLRADFYGYVLSYRPLRDALQEFTPQLVSSMSREELIAAIALPAQKLEVQLEAQLQERILDDVGLEPGNLPLLEFALTRLWSKQQNRTLTYRAYDEIGGVKKALANHAEQIYHQLSETEQKQAQRIFIQLVRPGEGTEDTRRLATREEVGEENWGLVSYLAGYQARLVVTGRDERSGEDTVEVVHEALIQQWGTLREWINVNRQFLIWQNRLKGRLLEWKTSSFDEGMLLRGFSLVEAQEWLDKRKDELSIAEIDFIDSSIAWAERELKQRELERQQNRLGIVSSFVSSLVATIVLGAALSRVSLGFELLLFLAAVTIAATAALLVAISKWRLLSLSSYRDEQLIIQDIRELESSINVESIRNFHRRLAINELQSPIRPLVRIFINTSKDVEAALNRESVYYQRQALGEVVQRLDAQLHTLTRSTNKYATRFYVIGQKWREVLNNYVSELAETIEIRQEISNPYIIGIPLNDTSRETFIERSNICLRIEQLLLDQRRPPLLLYGQRRMGKTSLLNNLERLLPNNIIPMFIDLQGASLAKDFAGFLYILAKEMVKSAKKQGFNLSPLTREALKDDPFTCFNEWIFEEVEQVPEQNIALLMLDEFEALDSAITKGRFHEQDVFGMLRHIIQHHPQFKVLLSGSHTLEEYQRWASYLINVQVVHISYFKEDETRRLIERPIKDFALRYRPDAVERVLQLTRCHPFLVQLLCNEIVTLKNEQDPSIRRRARLRDVEEAIPKALDSGSFFFADIQTNQVDSLGLSILRFLAAQGEGVTLSTRTLSQQFPNNVNSALKLLLQRELIEKVDDGYRFQVELIRRWFAQ